MSKRVISDLDETARRLRIALCDLLAQAWDSGYVAGACDGGPLLTADVKKHLSAQHHGRRVATHAEARTNLFPGDSLLVRQSDWGSQRPTAGLHTVVLPHRRFTASCAQEPRRAIWHNVRRSPALNNGYTDNEHLRGAAMRAQFGPPRSCICTRVSRAMGAGDINRHQPTQDVSFRHVIGLYDSTIKASVKWSTRDRLDQTGGEQ